MRDKTRISLDVMGGDIGPDVVMPAAIEFLREDPQTELVLVGNEAVIATYLSDLENRLRSRITVHHASQEVSMGESPAKALRTKKDSSMRVAINLVKQGEVDACVSAGNTGALMATARFVLRMLPHIDRPALITAIPSVTGPTYMLDLGANVDCSAKHLYQFAVMGSELVSAVERKSPRVGLLNIGAEDIKGNEQVKRAHELLSGSKLNYIGYVEGNDIYLSDVDVVVTDGFVGNVALKSSEGVAKMILHFMKEGFMQSWWTKLTGLLAKPALKSLYNKINPSRYNGATLLGLKGIVIKSHGGADVSAYKNAIHIAKEEVLLDIPNRIAHQVEKHLSNEECV